MASLLAAFVRRTEPFSVFERDDVVHVDRAIERQLIPHGEHDSVPPR